MFEASTTSSHITAISPLAPTSPRGPVGLVAISRPRRGRGPQFRPAPSPALLPHVRGSGSPVGLGQAGLPGWLRLGAAPSLLLRLGRAAPGAGGGPRTRGPCRGCAGARPAFCPGARLPGGGLPVRLHPGAAPSARLIFEWRRRGRHQKRLLLRRHLDHFLPLFRPSRGYGGDQGLKPPFLDPVPFPPFPSARAALLRSLRAQALSPSRSAPHSPARPKQDARETRTTREVNRACADPFLRHHYHSAANAHDWRAFLSPPDRACALRHHPGCARIRVQTNLTAPGV